MDKPIDGGSAFPTDSDNYGPKYSDPGMSLRDYFAAQALSGMLAYPGDEMRGSHHNNNDPVGVATMAYAYADAMIRVRGAA